MYAKGFHNFKINYQPKHFFIKKIKKVALMNSFVLSLFILDILQCKNDIPPGTETSFVLTSGIFVKVNIYPNKTRHFLAFFHQEEIRNEDLRST